MVSLARNELDAAHGSLSLASRISVPALLTAVLSLNGHEPRRLKTAPHSSGDEKLAIVFEPD
jgi:hypothetical protein